jgi:hypothetical protein
MPGPVNVIGVGARCDKLLRQSSARVVDERTATCAAHAPDAIVGQLVESFNFGGEKSINRINDSCLIAHTPSRTWGSMCIADKGSDSKRVRFKSTICL